MKTTQITALAVFTSIVSAHFNLNYPAARGFDGDKLGNSPCGGQNTVSSNRTSFPLSGGQIALTMGHIVANVEVLIGYGNSVGDAFNTILRPTFTEQGLGAFCMMGFEIPSNIDGMNATIQVITNGDPTGGLYNCADVTLNRMASGPASGVCTNNTGVSVSQASVTGNPNGTAMATGSHSTSTSSGKMSGTEGVRAQVGGLVVVGLAAVAFVL